MYESLIFFLFAIATGVVVGASVFMLTHRNPQWEHNERIQVSISIGVLVGTAVFLFVSTQA